jgi:hypothetical protein
MKRNLRLSRLFLSPVVLALLCIVDLTLIEVQDLTSIPKISPRQILISTSQPNGNQSFKSQNNSLAEFQYSNLTTRSDLNYEYLGNTNIGDSEGRTLFCIY